MQPQGRVFLLIVTASVSLVLVTAQTYQGRIEGMVIDPSGAVLAQAQITVTNIGTNVSRKLVTNSTGEYVAPDLEPGTYTVSAEATGFKKAVRSAVVLEVGRNIRIDLKLQPGAVNETVEVIAEQTMVDAVDTTLNGVLSNKAIN